MSQTPDLSNLSPGEKRKLLAKLLNDKAQPRHDALSYGQRALWLLHRLEPDSASYNVPWTWRVRSDVDVPALRRAFQTLIDRHRILRTNYVEANGEPICRVHDRAAVDFEQVAAADWSGDQLDRAVSEETHRPFNLQHGPVVRVRLFTQSARDHILLVTLHHIAYDLWSMMTLLNELGALYGAYVAGATPSLPAPRPYEEFVRWQADMLAGPDGERLWKYWRSEMDGEIPILALPTDRPRPALQTSRGTTLGVKIPASLSAALRDLAQAKGHTLFTLLLSAFEVLLARYSGEDDIVVGSPMTGRSRPALQDVVGYCLNTVPLRGDLSGDPSFTELLTRMRRVVLGALDHQDYPFALLVERLRPKRNPSHSTLFHALFALNKPHRREDQALSLSMEHGGGQVELGGLILEFWPVAQHAVVDDLVLLVSEMDGALAAAWQYNTDLFDRATIVRVAGHYQRLLESIVAAPDARISELSIVSEEERQQLVSGPAARAPYPRQSIHQLFEAQAERTPQAVAARYGAGHLAYDDLNRQANQLARVLRSRGVEDGAPVGLLVERSLNMIVGMLGILKAGGAYVPLDPTYPQSRLAFMIEDTAAPLVVTQEALLDRLPDGVPAVVCLDRDRATIALEDDTNPRSAVTPEHAAYIIYTSGSTGRPKGVVVPHRGVVRLVRNTDYVDLQPTDRIAQASNASFDAATFEVWGALLNGACVIGIEREVALSPRGFAAELRDHGITTLFLTTALFNQMAREAPGAFSGIRDLMFGGEAVDTGTVRDVLANQPPRRLLHVYGPTESTTFSSWHLIEHVTVDATTVPIGGPIAHTQLYVLDRHLQPVPMGVPGELYVGGAGLALGYLGRPELTAEKFLPDPFSAAPEARMYRTGDLVRWCAPQSVEFLGRVDHQVKIRGFRIEPGEIEAVLRLHPNVREVLVDVRELSVAGRSLVAYVVPQADASSMGEVRDYLRERLPDYMVPSVWVVLDRMPLTPNGKVDRAALPAPEGSGLEQEFVAPRAGLEEQIAQVWREVLRLERVGTRDSFFDLGGHSLLIVQAHAKLTTALQRELPIVDLFRFPTIESLARHLTPERRSASAPSRLAERVARRQSPTGRDGAIAVIGMAGRFPGAPDLPAFWQNLRDGVESIRRFTDDELRDAGVDERLLSDPRYVRARAVMDGVDLFDAAFFGYNPRDAELIDPQQRLFLECASEALERAGYDPDRYDGAVGVYGGATASGYFLNVLSRPGFSASVSGLQALIGAGADFLATRVSYKLNLRGPSVTVQTACSTSLVAIHHACRSLVEGECDMALAGGVSVGVPVISGHLHQEGGILSPDGHCRAFDADAQGTVTGHGIGIVVLKRLADAVADGDTIHAVIRGTAINNDGSGKVGYTAPSVEGQAEVIALAQAAAGVEPGSITYVEAHGTGTSLGDPIELAALTEAFGSNAPAASCAIGSLKTNVGHLDAAAGVAGLIKTVLSLEHGQIPPSLHYRSPNPKINFGSTPFFVNAALSPWAKPDDGPRRAGVSSFGIGGTNAHAVLEEAPAAPISGASRPWQILVISAKTRTALDRSAAQLAGYLKQSPETPFADVAHTLNVGRRIFAHRRVIVVRDAAGAAEALAQPDRSGAGAAVEPGERSCVFMFSGQGSQYAGMARALYETELSFRADVDSCCEALRPHLGWDLRDVLTAAPLPEIAARLKETAVTQPALFVIEYALARLWMRWGIRPSAMIGHSVGEYVAACLAGVFSLEDALALVAARGRLMQALPPGAMAAVGLAEAELTPLLGGDVSLAAVNGPALCVVAGPEAAITAFETRMSARGTKVRRLETSHAFHSAMMEPALDAFRAAVAGVERHAPSIPFVSDVTGTWITEADATSPDYWTSHLRQPVRFSAGMQELLQDPTRVFLEVGPGRTLASLARQQGPLAQGRTIATTLRHPQETTVDLAGVLETLGRLWLAGLDIDWAGFYAAESRRRVPLPTYPFERQRYWIDAPKSAAQRELPPLEKAGVADWFYRPVWKPSMAEGQSAGLAASARWMVFEDTAGLGAQVAGRLAGDVVTVREGERFSDEGGGTFIIDPGNAEHYRALIAALKAADRLPDVIGHFWGVTSETPDEFSDSGVCLRRGFYSLLYLAQALGESGSRASIRVGVVTTDVQNVTGDEPLSPSKAAVLGVCRVLPAEYPHITCRALDVAISDWARPDAPVADLVAQVVAETSDPVGAHRNGRWWTLGLDPAPLAVPESGAPSRLRESGVYLITGGLGGVGLTFAESLARAVRAKLILIGRAALPARSHWPEYLASHGPDDRLSRQIRAIGSIEEAGGEVEIIAADVSDIGQMRSAVERARRRFGRIDGVIHSAGVAASGVIQLKTRDMAEGVLAPKVAGTRALAQALEGAPIDFFVLCSSMASFFGGGGQSDYCAANAYLDAFASHYARRTGTFTVAVNWDTWQQVGMAVDAPMPEDLGRARAERLKLGIAPGEGFDALARILARGTSGQVAISTVSLPALIAREAARRVRPESAAADAIADVPAAPLHPRPEIATGYAAPVNEIERAIAEVWQLVLGIDHVGREDNFFDLGGHSLLLVQAHASLVERLGRALPVTDLFQFPTIQSLAEHLGGGRDVVPSRAVERRPGEGSNAIAIVGMAGRFPGAADLEAFWANLRGGVEAIHPLADDDLRKAGVEEQLLSDPRYVKVASALDGVDLFDAGFFGYAPREAEVIDPQHRVFLECAWEALESAGYDPKQYGGLIGVYAGAGWSSYLGNVFANSAVIESVGALQAGIGNRGDHLPTRVSYKLNLRGPSLNVQTACSTSLVAVHQACRSLVDGECDLALAGGVSIPLTNRTGYLYLEEGIASPDGHCRAFDAQARGTVWGDGVGVVVLKRLSEALSDGDTIHAVIRGTAINNDGAVKVGYTAPSVEGQAAVVMRAQAVAGVEPSTVSYVETHGTGTTLGDPIEIAALMRAFGAVPPGTCAIGTVKTNLGHLDAAAGVASLIKTVLALEHGELPPSLHYETPNPRIDFAGGPFFVNAALRPWTKAAGAPRRAGVSSFGIGGTNAHAVLEEAPAPPVGDEARVWQVLMVSAQSRAALTAATDRLADYLRRNPSTPLADVAYTLRVGRRSFAHRRVLVCRDASEAAAALAQPDRAPVQSAAVEAGERSCVFMFSGQGSQYAGMARELYESEPSFRADVDGLCDTLVAHLGVDLRDVIFGSEGSGTDVRGSSDLTETRFAQPALFVIEYALAQLWMRWGIRPSAFIGHSIGEYVAACLAGVFSVQDALALVSARGRLMQAMPAGAMLAVPLPEDEVTSLLTGELSLAAVNAPALCVVSGPVDAIAACESQLAARGVTARRLETSHAFHSAMMDPALEAFRAEVERVERREPRVPFLSNVTGTWISAADATSPDYWTRHLRQPVRFSAGVQELLTEPGRVLLEVGPGRTLASLVRLHGAAAQGRTIATTLRHPQESTADLAGVLQTLGRLWLTGLAVDWSGFHAGERRRRVPLPTYPFERQRYWVDAVQAPGAPSPRRLLKNPDIASWFYVPAWTRMPVTAPETGGATTGAWLVFLDGEGLGERLVEQCRGKGQAVACVRAGGRFASLDGQTYEIDPRSPADYDALVDALHAANMAPRRIVHLWSVGRSATDFARAQELGFYSVLYLTQALGRRLTSEAIDLTVVGNRMRAVTAADTIAPEKSPVLGLSLVIPQEYPQIRAGNVDVELEADADVRLLADQIHAEVLARPAGEAVAYRGSQRWVQVTEPATLNSAGTHGLRERGVYLITGGLGNIGLAIASRLARSRQARLVLVGRSAPAARADWQPWIEAHGPEDATSRQIEAVRALEAIGADVLVARADVSNLEQMRTVIAQARERFGDLHGVIHAAGLVGAASVAMQSIDRDTCEAQFRPKIQGLYVLDQVTAGLALDFCLLTSSLSSLLGGLGFAAYAASNQFLDSYVDDRQRRDQPAEGAARTRWVSVNFDGWAFDGAESASSAVGALEMRPEEGVESLVRILEDRSVSRVAVSTADLRARTDRYVRKTDQTGAPAGAPARHARPEIGTDYAAPADEIEQVIAEVWQNLLGIAQIGRDDNFFDLGGHSLLLVQVHATLAEKLGRTIAVTDLFQYSTIATLAAHLGGAPVQRARMAPIVTARAETAGRASADGIAIVGMAGRFPGAPDVEAFWENLRAGVESIHPLTDEELRRSGVDEQLIRNPRYVKATTVLEGVDLFDAGFFGYSPREADLLDPQHRLFLECAWEALERAGYDPRRYAGLIGVYAGASTNGYLGNIFSNPDLVETVGVMQATMGSKSDHLPTRVSYKLNLRGPSLNVQTACSTSLVAVHQACRSLVDGECDMALAGGVSISLGISPRAGYLYAEEGILSPDGHCRAFDAQAQGTVWGDGVGVVVLKRLADALADGDVVHSVILGTAINNDGSGKVGYTAPGVDGQAAVILRAQAVAGIDPASIAYVEAHGTGTALGDPIEIAALTQAFGPVAPQSVAIGTLKTNVGHLDSAAGVAGLIKATLALEHGEIPPSLHYETPNPKIDFAGSPFFVNTALTPWTMTRTGSPRRAGVSAFGIGGTNAHAVIEEAPPAAPSGPSRPWQVLVLSAHSRAALESASVNLAGQLDRHRDLNVADVAFTLQVGRQEFAHRRAIVCRDAAEAVLALGKNTGPHMAAGQAPPRPGSVAFLFPGQGAQHAQMASDLYRDEPIFRAVVDKCAERLRAPLGIDLRTVIYPSDGADVRLTETRIAQPALFAIEYALAALWRAWGLEPRALIGHSIGEYVAACVAGVFTLDDALDLVAARGALMQEMPSGSMLAVMLSEEGVEPFVLDGIEVAAVNGPSLCVLSGPTDRIEALEAELTGKNIRASRLHTSHAFHSAMMAPIVERFTALVARVPKQAPRVPFVSNVTGTWISDAEAIDPAYWGRHLRQPVRFADGLGTLLQDSRRVLLEVGPGRTLAGLVKQHPACSGDRLVVSSLRHPQQAEPDTASMLTAIAHLWVGGVSIDWVRFHDGERRRRVVLPTYPFERKRYWIEPRKSPKASATPRVERPAKAPLADWFYIPSWKRSMTAAPAANGAGTLPPHRWMLFADDAGLADRVERFLTVAGHDVIVVEPGRRFERLTDRRYSIDPATASHYTSLFQGLASEGRMPGVIGHMWGYTSEPPVEPRDSTACHERGFYSLLFLTQALGELGTSQPIVLGVVTTDVHEVTGDEMLCPSKATALGPCRVIPAEYANVTCRSVDLVASEWLLADDRQIAALIAEIMSGAAVSAYRRGHRWLEAIEAIRFDEAPDREPSRLRDRGVYLITGGLGGVGLTLAEYLARSANARLVLIGRHGLPERREWANYLASHGDDDRVSRQIHVVDALERVGAEVTVLAADVSNVAQMRSAVQEARRRYGRLDGVIHAAGVPGGGVMQLKTSEAAAAVMAPKVAGTQALSQAVAGLELDFFVLCSSSIALFGGGGQVDYCAANNYLDAFAREYARRTGTATISINWDGWRQVGMAVNTKVPGHMAQEREELLRRGITPQEGVEVFRRILAHCTIPQIAVSTVPLGQLVPATTGTAGRQAETDVEASSSAGISDQPEHERPELSAPFAPPTNEVERVLCEIWQELLGISQIGVRDNFFELGGHSLLAMQLTSRVQHELGTSLRLASVFQAPTVGEMADLVLQQLLEGEGADAAEALLSEAQALGGGNDPRAGLKA